VDEGQDGAEDGDRPVENLEGGSWRGVTGPVEGRGTLVVRAMATYGVVRGPDPVPPGGARRWRGLGIRWGKRRFFPR